MEAIETLHYLFDPSGLISDLLERFGRWVYVTLFAIVFAETWFVFTPFLPGDSLLFAADTFAGAGQIDVWVTITTLLIAAIAGDAVNYAIGRFLGLRLAARLPRLISARHLAASEAFFQRYGGRAVMLARFVPIVRTFVPFIAGMSRMPLVRFWQFNIAGAFVWVFVFVGAGYFFGQIPWVEKNLTLAMVLIVVASVVPILVKGLRQWRRRPRPAEGQAEEEAGRRRGSGRRPIRRSKKGERGDGGSRRISQDSILGRTQPRSPSHYTEEADFALLHTNS